MSLPLINALHPMHQNMRRQGYWHPMIRCVYCWEQWRVDTGQKYQMVRWVKCTLLYWWSEQRQTWWLRLFLCGLCTVLLPRFGGHIEGESVMCLLIKNCCVITATNILCAVLLWVSLIHVEVHIHYTYGSPARTDFHGWMGPVWYFHKHHHHQHQIDINTEAKNYCIII